ncbi:Uma2 family endonuclease [Laspinema sp. A4]|uniref:Uma2 family endonuclease n=1 Tax=Laspinema sp. D2d TaxID=2953686 RepID=UPI0021BA979F|nr:Uma2 family endonuclease [Laspinema sp. D2d]MCT7984303.1 Uma2 family endonuclease [Laspinema sp. D2d]
MMIPTAKRFTIQEYHRLTELGFFQEGDRIELIQGEMIQMAAKGTAHTTVTKRLLRALGQRLEERATMQIQDPLFLSPNSEPEPDIALVKNRTDDYLSGHPTPEDVILVIEIADSSLRYDREVKLPLYAKSGIADYWIFNLVNNTLECYGEPYQDNQENFGYRQRRIVLCNERVSLPEFSDVLLDLSEIFPPQS